MIEEYPRWEFVRKSCGYGGKWFSKGYVYYVMLTMTPMLSSMTLLVNVVVNIGYSMGIRDFLLGKRRWQQQSMDTGKLSRMPFGCAYGLIVGVFIAWLMDCIVLWVGVNQFLGCYNIVRRWIRYCRSEIFCVRAYSAMRPASVFGQLGSERIPYQKRETASTGCISPCRLPWLGLERVARTQPGIVSRMMTCLCHLLSPP